MNDEQPLDAPAETAALSALGPVPLAGFDSLLGDVPLELTVELGRVMLPLREVGMRLGPGSVIGLARLTGELLDVRINDRLVARAEAVAVGDRYAARIVEIVRPAEVGR